jgi:hypothetical protein
MARLGSLKKLTVLKKTVLTVITVLTSLFILQDRRKHEHERDVVEGTHHRGHHLHPEEQERRRKRNGERSRHQSRGFGRKVWK